MQIPVACTRIHWFSYSLRRLRQPRYPAAVKTRGALLLAVAAVLALASLVYADSGAWEYRHAAPAVSLKLPSSSWHQANQADDLADFWTRAPGITILAGLTSAQARTTEEHASALAEWKKSTQGDKRVEGKTAFEDGTTLGGDPYVVATYTLKAPQVVWGAQVRVRLRSVGLTVGMRFEGHPSGATEAQRASASRTFRDAIRSIASSVKYIGPSATGSSSSTAPPQARSASASAAPPARSAAPLPPTPVDSSSFRFDWGLPCQVPVTEVSQKSGKKLGLRYMVGAKATSTKSIEIQISGLTILTYDDIDVTGVEWQQRLKPVSDAAAAIPVFEVSPRGEFLKAEKFDRLVGRMVGAGLMKDEVARKMLASPMIQGMLEQAVGEYWRGWVEAWVAWPLQPGEERDAQVTVTPAPGVRFPMTTHRRFIDLRDGYARVEQSGVIEGAAVARAVEPLMKPLAQQFGVEGAPSGGVVKDGRVEYRYSAEVRPNGLRPLRTRSEKRRSLNFTSGSTSSDVEIHELEWDWTQAQGCKRK